MKTRHKGKTSIMTIKFDISKTYDRVEWIFFGGNDKGPWFANRWISLIMTCVTSPSYSILLNGQPSPSFHPNRGLAKVTLFHYTYIYYVLRVLVHYYMQENKPS